MSFSRFWLLCSWSLIWVYLAGHHVNIVVYDLFYRGQLADSPIKMSMVLLQEAGHNSLQTIRSVRLK